MNRRPSKSRSSYDAFSAREAARFRASSPDGTFFEDRKKPPFIRRLLFLVLLGIGLVLAANLAVNQFVFIDRVSVPVKGLDEAFDGYTILQISDLKGALYGGEQSRLRHALRNERCDAVVLTGDMISALGSAEALYALLDVMGELFPQVRVYFIPGDSDPVPLSMAYALGGSPYAPWVLGAQQRGASYLTAPVGVTRGEQTLWLTPSSLLSLDVDTMQGQYEAQYLAALSSGDQNSIELAVHYLRQLEDLRAAKKRARPGDIRIGVAHTPPSETEMAVLDGELSLLLCGHTLGGLIRLPLLGALFMPSQSLPRYGLLPGAKEGYGLSQSANPRVYVSPGLGQSDSHYPSFFFRLFNPPRVSLISLTPSTM